MTINSKLIALILFSMTGLAHAKSFTTEICTDQSGRVKVVIQATSRGKILQIDLYEDEKLLVIDSGPFYESPCHVQGSAQYGSYFSYGGCSVFRKWSAALSWDKYFRPIQLSKPGKRLELVTLDLNTFNCVYK